MVTIKTFADIHEANIEKGRLEAHGIRCFVKNESLLAADPLMTLAVGGFELEVSEKDVEKALKILV